MTCARIIYWRARPGQLDAYSRYLHAYVEPIDEAARVAGVLRSYATWIDSTPGAPWTHMRLFVFDDVAQRDVMKDGLARIAAQLMPDATQRAQRAALAETLRDKAGEQDLDSLPGT
jgi:hypothetical protein